ncbi:acyltransferase family protein [Ectobacillus sp. sgz5001026]|uniref:acyltransferase family protein n=1 Tax=Ectobacillus sp. sgz5001026 TaxID=3242473 RepID=UPI0036D334F1
MKTKKRLQLVQASRAIVPLLVILFHMSFVANYYFHYDLLGLTNLTRTGGADYFFILTGFMMYYIYSKDFGKKEKVKTFLIKRFSRLIPYYWLLTTVVIAFFYFVPIGYSYSNDLQTMLNSYFLLPQSGMPIIYSAWSLQNTLMFYIIFSLFIYSTKSIFKILIGIWISAILFFTLTDITFTNFFVSMIFNKINLDFALGTWCAYYALHHTIKNGTLYLTLGITGYIYTWVSGVEHLWRFDDTLMYSIAGTFLMFGLVSIDLKKEIKLPRVLQYLGNASFSIYLVHPPFLGLVAAILVNSGINNIIGSVGSITVCIVTVVCMGCLSHSYIEKPLSAGLQTFLFQQKQKRVVLRQSSAHL